MQKEAPFRLLAWTAACLILVNVLAAQLIIQAFYPGAGARLGMAVMVALGAVTVGSLVYVVVGWRAYLRRAPGD